MIPIPTLSQLYTQIKSDLEAQYGSSIPAFGKNYLRVQAGVQAAKLWLFYKHIGFLQKNIWVDTAQPEASGGTLERFGRIKLGRNPFAAVAGQYEVSVTGVVGAIINVNTVFKSADLSTSPGKLFVIDSAFTLLTNPDTIQLRALEAGLDSQLAIGDELNSTIPIANVNKVVTVSAEVIEPLAAETIEDYRNKVIEAFQNEAEGGAAADYRLWASEVQGVRLSFPYASYGNNNEVDLYVEATEADSTDGKGTPTAQILSDVVDAIELDPDDTKPMDERGRRPLGVYRVNVLAVTPKNIAITIPSFVGSTSEIRTLIEDALRDMIEDVRPFISGVDVLSERNDVLDLNKIIATIFEARPGSIFGTISMTVAGVTKTSYTFSNAEIPYLNAVTWS